MQQFSSQLNEKLESKTTQKSITFPFARKKIHNNRHFFFVVFFFFYVNDIEELKMAAKEKLIMSRDESV